MDTTTSARGRHRQVPAPFASRRRRPLTRVATAGLGAHVFLELGAGVGMPGASLVGPLPAAGLWAAGIRTVWRQAGGTGPSADARLAAVNGLGLAAVLGHLMSWPRRRTRSGLPWLRDCEGLGRELMPYYNTVLYLSGAAAVAALVTENRSAPARVPLLCLALTPLLARAQHAEHRRLARQASRAPAWWNRRLAR